MPEAFPPAHAEACPTLLKQQSCVPWSLLINSCENGLRLGFTAKGLFLKRSVELQQERPKAGHQESKGHWEKGV